MRSSASDEDGSAHSFAGQLESYLFVAPADVEARIRDVWHSGLSDRVIEYRRHHGLSDLLLPAPAVIVQRMVTPRAAGVAFAADPVTGRRGTAVVSAVTGVGEDLVSGKRDADTWHVDRTNAITFRAIASVSASVGGTQSPSLADREVIAVATLARTRAALRPAAGHRVGDRRRPLLLLQSRPITTLAHAGRSRRRPRIWDNSNIAESYSGVTTPLTFSFARDDLSRTSIASSAG